jgi:hypothetical protein
MMFSSNFSSMLFALMRRMTEVTDLPNFDLEDLHATLSLFLT